MTFNELKKNLKKDFSGFKKLKVAVLADSAIQLLTQAIRGAGYESQFDLEIFEADFNQIDRQILDLSSQLYAFKPDVIIIFEAAHMLLQKFNKTDENTRHHFAKNKLDHINRLVDALQHNLKSKIIYFNFVEEPDYVFGNFSSKVEFSFIFQQRKLNYQLAEYASKKNDLFLFDMSAIQNKIGRNQLFSPSIYINSEMVVSIDALPIVAESLVKIVASFSGKIKKCIILDLDNTVWGGVIGDDGLENIQIGSLGVGKAYTEFQHWIKKLKQRGIIICVCSKNTDSIAKEPFEKHPEMVLRLKDISVFLANWQNKVDNIIRIQQILNIGYDSMVFLDDNPFERNIVRQNLPDITVPELPKDPADFVEYLASFNLFETISYSSEDANRTELYRKESERVAAQASFTHENDFLKSLNMLSDVQPFNSFSIPRVAQLSQRSNQFNLRTIRYTEEDIRRIVDSDRHFTFSFTLEDKFGHNGLICAVILEQKRPKELFIDTWFMSCRVLKRGMENFVLNTIADFASRGGHQTLLGEYIPTVKNVLVKNHYSDLGFVQNEPFWHLDVTAYQPKECYINKKG